MVNTKSQVPLAKQIWELVTIHQVYHAFLKGEYGRCIETFGQIALLSRALIDNPDFTNDSQNCKRSFLLCFRAPLLLQIPCSTIWYKVISLKETHLNELIVIGRCGWDDENDKNELLNVAKRKPEIMNSNPLEWDMPILWGHTKEGPFTIIEGNHRLVAYVSLQTRPELNTPVYVGLSNEYCYWHLPDPVN